MYNLYTQEKHLNEELSKKKEDSLKMRYKEKHKKLLTSMYENYENRVKNFITDMTHPSQIIVLQNNPKISSTRATLMNEREIMKSFVFKGYKTEKERIADNIKNNIFLFSYDKREEKNPKNAKGLLRSTNLPRKKKIEIGEDVIVQPEMRFRPRTDLERVFDAINGNYLKDTDRQILNRQLQLLDLLTYRKPSSNTLSGLIGKMHQPIQEIKEEEESNGNGDSKAQGKNGDKKEMIAPKRPWVRRIDLNTEAKGILSDYHYKTHFKAAEEIAEGKIVVQVKKKDKSHFEEPSPSSPKAGLFKSITESSAKKPSKRHKDPFSHHSYDEGNDLNSIMSYDNYDMNTNPVISKSIDRIDPNQMTQLSKLAFTQPTEEDEDPLKNLNRKLTVSLDSNIIKSKRSLKQKINIVDDNNVLIDNESYNKGTQLDIIASKVLNKCNVYHNKSLHNNTVLKKKEGKLMFTNGMSILQFEKRYNLQ